MAARPRVRKVNHHLDAAEEHRESDVAHPSNCGERNRVTKNVTGDWPAASPCARRPGLARSEYFHLDRIGDEGRREGDVVGGVEEEEHEEPRQRLVFVWSTMFYLLGREFCAFAFHHG